MVKLSFYLPAARPSLPTHLYVYLARSLLIFLPITFLSCLLAHLPENLSFRFRLSDAINLVSSSSLTLIPPQPVVSGGGGVGFGRSCGASGGSGGGGSGSNCSGGEAFSSDGGGGGGLGVSSFGPYLVLMAAVIIAGLGLMININAIELDKIASRPVVGPRHNRLLSPGPKSVAHVPLISLSPVVLLEGAGYCVLLHLSHTRLLSLGP